MLEGIDDEGLATAAALRAQWRTEEEQWTRASLEHWEHRQTFVDVLRACMHRGDTVALAFAARTFTGVLTAVGEDMARIETADGSVDAHLDAAAACSLRVVTPARAGGDRGDRSVATFRARLLHLEGGVVELGVRVSDDALVGRLRVGHDQVSVIDRDGARRYVPIASVSWVRPADVD